MENKRLRVKVFIMKHPVATTVVKTVAVAVGFMLAMRIFSWDRT